MMADSHPVAPALTGARGSRPRDGTVSAADAVLPSASPWLVNWFRGVAARRLRGNFNAVRLAIGPDTPAASGAADRGTRSDGPLVLYTNHASWWDPLVLAWATGQFFPDRQPFAPIAAAALEQYRFFRRLGFFGVEANTRRGAATFLRVASAILERPGTVLVITPQGRFADVRERPLRFQRGLAELATRGPGCRLVPLAIEYSFWEERLPEVLLRFGPAVTGGSGDSADALGTRLEAGLARTQEELARLAVARDPGTFQTLLAGRAGVGGVYDAWRRFRARCRGETFDPHHGKL